MSTLQDELKKARKLAVALGAFNVYNMELARGVITAATRLRAPVFIQSNFNNLQAAGAHSFVVYIKELARRADVSVALHLDHGQSPDEVTWAIDHGFTSVMYDGSHLPLEENITITKEVVALARRAGVTVEGELGAISGDEDRARSNTQSDTPLSFTDPYQAEVFAKETGVDILAVSVGNVHGHYRGEPNLRFDLLEEIYRRTQTPLALHGASGLSAYDLKRAACCGVVKVNFNTDLRQAYVNGMKAWLTQDEGQLDFAKLRKALIEPVADVVAERIQWLESFRATLHKN